MGINSIVVLKFGGSVLENKESIERACSIVEETLRKGKKVVIVVSAMKGVTDKLLSLASSLEEGSDPQFIDELISSGERMAARNFSYLLRKIGLESVIVEPGNEFWPIITDSNHGDANPLMEITREEVRRKILPLLEKGIIPVVCGFIGTTKEGKITTLGRGGSDTTAVILGSSLEASEVVLIKDVDGVYSSDPDVIENPVLIGRLGAHEAEMLASSGAKFLHSKALRYSTPGLRIRVTSLEKLDSGTVIEDDIPELEVSVGSDDVRMITIIPDGSDVFPAFNEFGELVSKKGGKIISMTQLGNSLILYCANGENLEEEIHTSFVLSGKAKAVSSFNNVSMITVRGRSLETKPGLIQRVTQPLARKGINIFGLVTIFSSIKIFVSSSRSEEAADMIRQALGEEK
jgi:aspartate kinase